MDFAKNLRRLLTERGMSVAHLSRTSGISAKTIYHWLGGQKPRDIEQLIKLCRLLNVSLDQLVRKAEDSAEEKMSSLPQGQSLNPHLEEIHTGIYEVVLRKIKR